MQISISKFTGVVTGILSLGVVIAFGYFTFNLFFGGDNVADVPTVTSINLTILGPKAQKAAAVLVNASDKVTLKKKDIAFTESSLYKSFTETPDSVPLSESRGRPDPFVPYVAP